ncbi:MAG: hypothetical protein ACI4SA_01260 [Lachnospiraceae bacterium]
MKLKCEYCDSWINDYDAVCPNCGATNSHYTRQADGTPKTIEELKRWAKEKNLPLKEMRTYIGEDYRGAKAFGIYKDAATETFIVYKNKADGTRVIRYQGDDEAYAVNELYQKMKERVAQQKSAGAASRSGSGYSSGSGNRRPAHNSIFKNRFIRLLLIIIIIQILLPMIFSCSVSIQNASSPRTGYYTYNNTPYYYSHGNWYTWLDDGWTVAAMADWMTEDSAGYYDSYSYDSSAVYEDFSDSPYYTADSDLNDDDDDWGNDDWDDDSDWDYDYDWDSGFDDWDSDW